MEKLAIAFLGLMIVLFIGSVIYKETFADCASPGAMTWTITLDPGKCGTISQGSEKTSDTPSSDTPAKNAELDDYDLSDFGASPTILNNVPQIRDASGNLQASKSRDSSGNSLFGGNWLNLSLSDVASLMASSKKETQIPSMRFTSFTLPPPPPPPAPVLMMANPAGVAMAGSGEKNGLYNQFEGPLANSINEAAWPLLGAEEDLNTYMYTPMTNQGQQYLSGSPMNNPADLSTNPDYIRRDSIPCWSCNP